MAKKSLYMASNRVIRVTLLIGVGFDFTKDFFVLSTSELCDLAECMKADRYTYDSPLGRSRLRSYYYSLQRTFARLQAAK